MARENDFNLDPISKEPGAHPVGTGLGAAAGGAVAGAAAGTFGGPAGALVGAVVGAVAGGLGGKAAAEAVNPTAEAAYWESNYQLESYYETGRPYDDYAPAYRLGLFGYGEYGGTFDETEGRLSEHWDAKKERSTLSWTQAREASRAAWNRVGGQKAAAVERNDDAVDVLNNLLETCRDGEYGFRECAEHTKAQDIRSLLARRADDCRSAAVELQALIRQMGGEIEEGGTVGGALHRGWVSVKATLSGYSDKAMLDECERGEDVALAQYRKALKQSLPVTVKAVVERQAEGVQRNHDQIKALRDALKNAS
jgi:uncharacterized protein (TIGR02284 family)